MNTFFLDSSALTKRYLSERGTAFVRALVAPEAGDRIVIAEITHVEVAAALASRHRMSNGITRGERDAAYNLLAQHIVAEYVSVPLATPIIEAAMQLTQTYRLRGYDAVQLACALLANTQAVAVGLVPLTFVCADDDLNAAARAEGLASENPNHHS